MPGVVANVLLFAGFVALAVVIRNRASPLHLVTLAAIALAFLLRAAQPWLSPHWLPATVELIAGAMTIVSVVALVRAAPRRRLGAAPADTLPAEIVDSSPTAQIMVDEHGHITLFNRMAERIFGYERAEVLGEPVELLVPDEQRDPHRVQRTAFARRPAARAMGANRELFGLRKDGSRVPVEIGLMPVTLGDATNVLASVIDITTRKQVEQSLQDYADALTRSNQELEYFAQFASHDLQEPLRKLTAFSSLLAEDMGDDLPESAKRDLEYIIDAAARMRSLVRGLLDLSRSGRRDMLVTEVDLGECCGDALETLSMRIEETGADVRVGELPTVQGDRALLTQLFQNLIGNALKFTRAGERPRVWVSCATDEPDVAPAEGPVLCVADNGIGIDEQQLDSVFTPFRRLHGRGEYPGAGIGLAICNKVVERHRGRIWVTSEAGRGSRFLFTLPPRTDGSR